MFATGIENSYPTINHGKTRVDEMAVCGHYDRWREDFDCVQEIGINFLRYGPPIHKTYLGPNKFDWEFADQTFAELEAEVKNRISHRARALKDASDFLRSLTGTRAGG